MGDLPHSSAEEDETTKVYPPKPVKPLDSDCCGSGCVTCVFDLYELELKRWQKRCDDIESKVDNSLDDDVINIYGYTEFKIVEIANISETIKIFKFHIPHNRRLPLKCGEHIVARCIDEHGIHIVRPYTPVSKLDEKGSFLIAVKLYATGKMSKRMRHWNIGTSVEWRGPFGEFEYNSRKYHGLLLLSGGTGITPMIQILHHILDNENDITRVYLIHSSVDASSIIMLEELRQWNDFWNCDVRYCLTGGGQSKMKYGDKVYYKRIDQDILLETVNQTQRENINVFICGTRLFNKDMFNLVREVYGMDEQRILCL